MGKIVCQWMKRRNAVINPDGQVYPCCYFANVAFHTTSMIDKGRIDELKEGHIDRLDLKLIKKYNENPKAYNIFHTDMKDIVNSDWFKKDLPESWEDSDLTVYQCERFCRVKDENV